jgi:hypothetical protein
MTAAAGNDHRHFAEFSITSMMRLREIGWYPRQGGLPPSPPEPPRIGWGALDNLENMVYKKPLVELHSTGIPPVRNRIAITTMSPPGRLHS